MKKLSGLGITLALLLVSLFTVSKAQLQYSSTYHYKFDSDSLSGFDEAAATKALKDEHYIGEEFSVKLFWSKRTYINNKFNLWPASLSNPDFTPLEVSAAIPGCNNEDFEASPAGTIAAQSQIAGWTITKGSVQPPNNACNLTGCCGLNPSESYLISAPSGFIDPIIGSCYPIYSVFGTVAGDPNGPIHNPQMPQLMYGNNFLRLNSSALGSNAYSIEKLSKTILVTPSNALFQFAYIFVTSTGHFCCSASAFQFKLTNVTTNSAIACPGYSIMGPSSACPGYTVNNVPYLNSGNCSVATATSLLAFNKWQMIAVDLTAYMGQSIKLDILVSDCDAAGHYGYAYIDAQCGPVGISVNNQPVYSNTVIAQSCSFPAFLSAPNGFSNYSWTGPSGFTGTTAIVSTTVPGTYVVNMGNGAQCSPTSMTVQLGFGSGNLTVSSSSSLICAGQSVTLSASAMNSYTWSNGSNSQNTIVTPLQSTVYVVATTDATNCVHIGSVGISVSNPVLNIFASDTTICDSEMVQLSGTGVQTYTWSTGATNPTIIVSPSVTSIYTASGTDANGCLASSSVFTLWVSGCVGIPDVELENENIRLFPNPNRGEFVIECNVQSSSILFELYSLDGKKIFSEKLQQAYHRIKLDKISTGIYTYSILNQNEILKKGKLQIE